MSDLDDFLTTTLARQVKAAEAIHNGDAGPRLAMWSSKDPVTVLGAARSATELPPRCRRRSRRGPGAP